MTRLRSVFFKFLLIYCSYREGGGNHDKQLLVAVCIVNDTNTMF